MASEFERLADLAVGFVPKGEPGLLIVKVVGHVSDHTMESVQQQMINVVNASLPGVKVLVVSVCEHVDFSFEMLTYKQLQEVGFTRIN